MTSENEIVLGDIVETCSLDVGRVIELDGDDIMVRAFDEKMNETEREMSCSVTHCGIVKLTHEQAILRLAIPIKVRGKLYMEAENDEEYEEALKNYKSC
jgi:hypothetical protein